MRTVNGLVQSSARKGPRKSLFLVTVLKMKPIRSTKIVLPSLSVPVALTPTPTPKTFTPLVLANSVPEMSASLTSITASQLSPLSSQERLPVYSSVKLSRSLLPSPRKGLKTTKHRQMRFQRLPRYVRYLWPLGQILKARLSSSTPSKMTTTAHH